MRQLPLLRDVWLGEERRTAFHIPTSIGHTQNAWLCVLQQEILVLELSAIDGCTASPISIHKVAPLRQIFSESATWVEASTIASSSAAAGHCAHHTTHMPAYPGPHEEAKEGNGRGRHVVCMDGCVCVFVCAVRTTQRRPYLRGQRPKVLVFWRRDSQEVRARLAPALSLPIPRHASPCNGRAVPPPLRWVL